jgi:glycine/D-amino acid oxidase-like deaminating enzyme
LVLGGGIVGLGVAYQLCQAGFAGVTVLAAQLSPNTTSDVAGASIVPYTDSADPEEQARVTKWTKQVSRVQTVARMELHMRHNWCSCTSAWGSHLLLLL